MGMNVQAHACASSPDARVGESAACHWSCSCAQAHACVCALCPHTCTQTSTSTCVLGVVCGLSTVDALIASFELCVASKKNAHGPPSGVASTGAASYCNHHRSLHAGMAAMDRGTASQHNHHGLQNTCAYSCSAAGSPRGIRERSSAQRHSS